MGFPSEIKGDGDNGVTGPFWSALVTDSIIDGEVSSMR